MDVLGVIPARYASSRLPGKPLATVLGRPLVEWVHSAARRALDRVVVATDDDRIVRVVHGFGGKAVMTPRTCRSGTDRMAFVARKIKARYYVNIQGDEPMMNAGTIRAAVRLAKENKGIATAATNLKPEDRQNPNAVKVVVGENARALYFSRSMVPHSGRGLKHLGLYVYPRAMLLKFVRLRPTALEQTEKLEQLRALYYGLPIYVAFSQHDSVGVDTPNDLKRVRKRMERFS